MAEHEYVRNFDMPGLPGGPQGAKGRAIPKFSETTYQDEHATQMTGRPVVRSRVVCEIFIPGDHLQSATHYVNPDNEPDPIIQRFPEEWARFKRTMSNEDDPTKWRIDNWPMLNPAQVQMLRMAHVYYVEDLAELTDQQLMDAVGIGGKKLRKQAQAAVETAKMGAAPARLINENEAQADRIKQLEAAVANLSNQLEGALRAQQKAAAVTSETQTPPAVKVPVDDAVVIPKHYQKMKVTDLKPICEKIAPAVPVKTQADAVELIEEYLAAKANSGDN